MAWEMEMIGNFGISDGVLDGLMLISKCILGQNQRNTNIGWIGLKRIMV